MTWTRATVPRRSGARSRHLLLIDRDEAPALACLTPLRDGRLALYDYARDTVAHFDDLTLAAGLAVRGLPAIGVGDLEWVTARVRKGRAA